ncbi:hypothetical protein C8J55DRAFT_556163 [Lentinula edodes]|uniref:Uncharacterized protein n=1 Tax=Lentinula lateritia TaxID=40482 RepID=A0A9W9B022_9AGAR|nr:hypothetical protein C8J55DRAFT_556163 [Lentinula edodes]
MAHYNYLPDSISTALFKDRRKPRGIYDKLAQAFVGMGPNAIANAKLNQDFFRFNFSKAWSSNYSFWGIDSKQYTANIFGEIVGQAHGTYIGAQGNHFIGNDPTKPKLLDDYTKTKCTIVIGCLSFPSVAVSDLFYNQICTLSSIRNAYKEEEDRAETDVIPKETVKALRNGGELDAITLTGPPLYTVMKKDKTSNNDNSFASPAKRNLKKRNFTSTKNDDSGDPLNNILPDESASKTLAFPTDQQIFAGAEYDHRLMPDFGGPVFAMKKAKLIQPQWTNIRNKLIVPWKNYDSLRLGTLVVATVCFEVFVMSPKSASDSVRKIYHATITSLRVIAESDVIIMPPMPSVSDKKRVSAQPIAPSAAASALASIDWCSTATSSSLSGSDHTLDGEDPPKEGSEVITDGKQKKARKQ